MSALLPDEIYIRHAAPQDVNTFRDLRLESLKNHPDAFGMDYNDALLRNQEYWENSLKFNRNEKALFFALHDSQLIGMTGIYRNMSTKTLHAATIWGVYVRLQWRGKHISEALIQKCLDWAKEQNIAIVKLAVVTNNIPAIRGYERCGFTTYGTEPKAIRHDGIYYDEYLMSIEMKDDEAEQEF